MRDQRRPILDRRAAAATAFTLTELLIVIGLITLIVTLAIPTFNAITGGRSIDAAENQISAMLGQARTEAIGLQEERGVLFYTDVGTGRAGAAMVRAVSQLSDARLALDLVPNREQLLLPVGIAVHTVINSAVPPGGGQRTSEGYLGYNNLALDVGVPTPPPPPPGPTPTRYGGVILFDANGRLTQRRYKFAVTNRDPAAATAAYTRLGGLLYNVNAADSTLVPPVTLTTFINKAPSGPGGVLASEPSQVAFVIFDTEGFVARQFTAGDPQVDPSVNGGNYTGGGTLSEQEEDKWIDGNAVPYLVSRYNGTLLRGE